MTYDTQQLIDAVSLVGADWGDNTNVASQFSFPLDGEGLPCDFLGHVFFQLDPDLFHRVRTAEESFGSSFNIMGHETFISDLFAGFTDDQKYRLARAQMLSDQGLRWDEVAARLMASLEKGSGEL